MWEIPIQNPILKAKIAQKLQEIDLVFQQVDSNSQLGLMSGNTGRLLYHCYRAQQLDSSDFYPYIERELIQSIENLKTVPTAILSIGVSGVLWAINHLDKGGFIEIDQENLIDVSASLSNALIKNSEYQNFDYLHGANGIALYLLQRQEPEASIGFEQWLNQLLKSGIKKDGSISWETIINAKDNIKGLSLGLAHGIPSVILIMIQFLKKQEHPIALEILNSSIKTLLDHIVPSTENQEGPKLFFPNYIANGEAFYSPRLAWCYGDLGCALALYYAGQFLNQKKLIDLSNEIMFHHAENLSEEQTKFNVDADICHGTVGVAHIFARFYNATKIETYRKAAEFYYAKTLDLAYFNDGLAGFKHFSEDGFINDRTLLEGLSGIGLSLISSISPVEPKWDSAFLLS